MIIERKAMREDDREKMRGGEGVVHFTHFVPEKTQKNLRLAAEVTLPPGASIGYHEHVNETEYFVFVEGSGMACDDGTDIPVKKGDVMITGGGASHSVLNTGGVPLIFHAFIVQE